MRKYFTLLLCLLTSGVFAQEGIKNKAVLSIDDPTLPGSTVIITSKYASFFKDPEAKVYVKSKIADELRKREFVVGKINNGVVELKNSDFSVYITPFAGSLSLDYKDYSKIPEEHYCHLVKKNVDKFTDEVTIQTEAGRISGMVLNSGAIGLGITFFSSTPEVGREDANFIFEDGTKLTITGSLKLIRITKDGYLYDFTSALSPKEVDIFKTKSISDYRVITEYEYSYGESFRKQFACLTEKAGN